MKILMVLMGLNIGGAETHVVELSKELARRKNDITVASSGGVYVKELEKAGIRHVQLPLGSRHIYKMLKSLIGLYRLIKTGNFDVVHAHARIPAFLCGLIRKHVFFNFITTAHWVFKTGPLLNILTNWGERTIAVSEDIKTYLMDNYSVPNNHITVTINGIDTDKFSPGVPADAAAEEFNLKPAARAVHVSRIDTDRSAVAFMLIEAMPKLCEKHPDFELVIVGAGNDYDRLCAEAEKCNALLGRRAVILTGGRTDINNFIACADVFIGVSRAALEAMAMSKPTVLAGNEGYIGTFDESRLETGIQTNFCCRGCEESTPDKLYSDIAYILDKTPAEREKMGNYNRSVILDLYSAKKMADDCEKAYADILSIDRRRPFDIMISGYYGYKNTGDDSLLWAIINNLTEKKEYADITVLSANPSETEKIYKVRSINRFNIFKIMRYMRRTKLLISGGGSLVQDVTSTKSLLYYLFVIKSAKKYGMKVMVYASGIGPLKKHRNKALAAKILNTTDIISLREPASYDELKLLGVSKPPVYVTTDPAFALEKAADNEIRKILEKEGLDFDRQYYVVSLRPWKYADDDFCGKLAALCDYIGAKYNMTALFIPMQGSEDTAANRSVADKLKSGYKLISPGYSAQELMGIISKAKLAIGMRLHVLIYAAVTEVPLFGLSYDPKVDSILAYLGQHYKESVGDMDVGRMKKCVDEIMDKHTDIKDSISRKTQIMKEKTKEDARLAIELLK